MKNKIKNFIYILPMLLNKVFADECSYGGIQFVNGTPQIVQNSICPSSDAGTSWATKMDSGADALEQFFTFFYGASITISVICLMIGAVQLAMSTGNQQAKMKARNRIKISLIVLAILGGLGTIVNLVAWMF